MTQNTSPKPSLAIVDNSDSRIVSVIQQNTAQIPDLYLDVYVHGDEYEQSAFARLFVQARCRKAKTVDEADVVIFTGGDDVNPALYGVEAHPSTKHDDDRDQRDIEMYAECYAKGVPMVGVCRGMQFLHVMNGGALFQHVGHTHYGDHPMYAINERKMIDKVSSVHHQMVIEQPGMEVVGFCGRSKERWLSPSQKEEALTHKDIEAMFYRDTCCFGVQGHPEYFGYEEYAAWFFRALDQYINCNVDLVLTDGVRRLKPDILEQRESVVISGK